MRKAIILFIILISVISCATHIRSVLLKESASGTVEHNNQTYYIYNPTEFKKVKENFILTYLGTTKEYHLFRTWYKDVVLNPNSVETSFFALKKEHCIVENEKTPEEEKRFHHQTARLRYAILKNGKFIVLDRNGNPNVTDNN